MGKQKPNSDPPASGHPDLWNPEETAALDVPTHGGEPSSQSTASEHSVGSGNAAAEIEALRQQHAQQLQEAESQRLRAQAESENARRRLRRDLEDQLKYASLPLVQDLVDVVDNLGRALAAAEQNHAEPSGTGSIVNGIRMVQTQLESVLEKHGCRRIDAAPGTEFDPRLHSALQMQSHAAIPANHVAIETRMGYRLHERVVRPAEVIVSTGPSPH